MGRLLQDLDRGGVISFQDFAACMGGRVGSKERVEDVVAAFKG